MKIFINPGHAPNGNPDPGAVNPTYGYKEAIIAGDVGAIVARCLRNVGYETVCYQSNSLYAITENANFYDYDLFVSIHCNAGGGTGIETYCYKSNTNAEKLAECIQKQVVDAIGLRDRGVKYKQYTVLTDTNMPAALVELGFMDSDDINVLIDRNKQIEYARAIARGITDYVKMVGNKG